MQINLLDNPIPELGDFNRAVSRAKSKKCIINQNDFLEYNQILNTEMIVNPKLKYHVLCVKEAIKKEERNYKYFNPKGSVEGCMVFNDSHNEIEKTGLQIYCHDRCVILSMENFLDIALKKCCGATPKKIRRLPDYDLMSFYTMNLALHEYSKKVYLSQFKGLDPMLDNYLRSTRVYNPNVAEYDEPDYNVEGEELNVRVFLGFYYGIVLAASNILTNCVSGIYKTYKLSIRSQGFSNFVLNTLDSNIELPSVIQYTDQDVSFDLPVQVYKRGEYLLSLKKVI